MNKSQIEYRRTILINYINIYLSKKKIEMKGFLRDLKGILKGDKKITVRQLEAIIPFLDKEKEFKGRSMDEIKYYFSPLLKNYKEKDNGSNPIY